MFTTPTLLHRFFSTSLDEDFLHVINQPNVPPHELKLKLGIDSYIMRNLLPEEGLVNNARIQILEIKKYLIKVKLLLNVSIHYVPRIWFNLEITKRSVRMRRKQFPIRPSYASTFNRSQGSTYIEEAVDLRDPVFSRTFHGVL